MAFTTRMKLEIATELRLPAIRDDHHAMSNAHTSDAVISGNNESMVDKRFNVMSRAKPALEVGPCSISWKQNSLEKSLRYGLFTYILDKTTVINFP